MAVILEEIAIVKVLQAHYLIVAPLTGKSPFCEESHFTAIYANLRSRPRRLRHGKFLALHKSVLTEEADLNSCEGGQVNRGILVRLRSRK